MFQSAPDHDLIVNKLTHFDLLTAEGILIRADVDPAIAHTIPENGCSRNQDRQFLGARRKRDGDSFSGTKVSGLLTTGKPVRRFGCLAQWVVGRERVALFEIYCVRSPRRSLVHSLRRPTNRRRTRTRAPTTRPIGDGPERVTRDDKLARRHVGRDQLPVERRLDRDGFHAGFVVGRRGKERELFAGNFEAGTRMATVSRSSTILFSAIAPAACSACSSRSSFNLRVSSSLLQLLPRILLRTDKLRLFLWRQKHLDLGYLFSLADRLTEQFFYIGFGDNETGRGSFDVGLSTRRHDPPSGGEQRSRHLALLGLCYR